MGKRLYTEDEAVEIARLSRVEALAGELFVDFNRRSTVTLTLENARDKAIQAVRIAEVFVNVVDHYQSEHLRRLRDEQPTSETEPGS